MYTSYTIYVYISISFILNITKCYINCIRISNIKNSNILFGILLISTYPYYVILYSELNQILICKYYNRSFKLSVNQLFSERFIPDLSTIYYLGELTPDWEGIGPSNSRILTNPIKVYSSLKQI